MNCAICGRYYPGFEHHCSDAFIRRRDEEEQAADEESEESESRDFDERLEEGFALMGK